MWDWIRGSSRITHGWAAASEAICREFRLPPLPCAGSCANWRIFGLFRRPCAGVLSPLLDNSFLQVASCVRWRIFGSGRAAEVLVPHPNRATRFHCRIFGSGRARRAPSEAILPGDPPLSLKARFPMWPLCSLAHFQARPATPFRGHVSGAWPRIRESSFPYVAPV